MICWALASALAGTAFAAHGESYLNSSVGYQNGSMGGSPYQTFISSPSKPVQFNVQKFPDTSLGAGYLFIAPRGTSVEAPGAYIFSGDGELIWDGSEFGQAMSFTPKMYKGQPVIAMWQGEFNANGYGMGHGLLINQSYQVVANISAQIENAQMDFHEFTLTENDTALFTAYPVQPYDLSSYESNLQDPANGYIMQGVAQEIDIESGDVIFTWHSLDHVDPHSCFTTPADTGGSSDNPWDYFHINSIEKDSKGNYLISSRHCSALYYVSGADGSILWTIGGQNSSFTMGDNTTFWYQHDARWRDNETTISLFDNAATGWDAREETARGLLLNVDFESMTVSVNTEMLPFNRTPSPSQGSTELQPNGNWLCGWGQIPYVSEYSPTGELLWAVQFGVGDVQGYRAHRANWTGQPTTQPSLALQNGNNSDDHRLFMSWNGATEVKTWEVLGANDTSANPETLWNVTRDGFESEFSLLNPGLDLFIVRARHDNGTVLGQSNYVSRNGSDVGPATTPSASGDNNSSEGGVDNRASGSQEPSGQTLSAAAAGSTSSGQEGSSAASVLPSSVAPLLLGLSVALLL